MKNNFIKFILLFILILFSIKVASAFGSYSMYGGVFGGKITSTKAVEIEALESVGYICDLNGTSLSLRPMRGPSSVIIPFHVRPKTRTVPGVGKSILGRYAGKTTVTCRMPCGATECVDMVILDTVTYFGTSK
jgi:hypothetical protein